MRETTILRALVAVAALSVPVACLGQGYTVTTVAGGGISSGPLPEQATKYALNDEEGVAVDSSGNVYFAGGVSNVIYKVSGGQISIIAGKGASGYSGDGGAATSALLNDPQGVAVDSSGNLYITDYLNNVIREITSGGTITTIAGNGSQSTPVAGPALSTGLESPVGIAVDANGNVYFTEGIAGGYIVKLSNGTLSIVAGNGISGPPTDGMPATTQPVQSPHSVAVDAPGNLYIATSSAGRILKVNASDGTIMTVAGSGQFGTALGDGGPALSAGMTPFGVAVDGSGNIFIADSGNNAIREVTGGTIMTVAGTDKLGSTCMMSGVPAISVGLNNPKGIAVGASSVYFSDSSGCVRALGAASSLTGPASITKGGIVSASQFGQFTAVAPGSWIEIYGSNLAGDTRSWATADFKGSSAPTSLDGTSVTVGGQAAFVDYISPGQVNAQVPSPAPPGLQPVIVTSPGGASAAVAITVNQTSPGLLAPASFTIAGKQYVAALFADGTTYVLPPGTVTGITSRRATAGTPITMYGVGFGAVTPATAAGQIVAQSNSLAASIQFSFGGLTATSSYAGLAPGFVGLYQFNVMVPNVAASDTVPVTFILGGVKGTQTLYTAVGN